MKLKKLIRDYFSFSKSEVNGTLVLIPLIFFFILSPYFYRQIFGIKYNTQTEDRRLLDSLVSLIDGSFIESKPDVPTYFFKFNPNTASVSELNTLGIPRFLSARIDNYRNKGGKFHVKKDLLKIFDFPDSLYRQLEHFITLPSKPVLAKANNYARPSVRLLPKSPRLGAKVVPSKEPKFVLNLNKVDTTALKKVKGIGSSYAKRIVGYRNLLGGFHSLNQLEEVYGMTDTLFQIIIPYLAISDSLVIKQVPINLATFKELLAHPYIDYEQTKEILNVKSKSGKFMKSEDLFRLTLMDSVDILRLLPYIRF